MNKTVTTVDESSLIAALANPEVCTAICPCEMEITQEIDVNGTTLLYAPDVFTFNGGSFVNYLFPNYTLLRPYNGDWRTKESTTPIPNRRFDNDRWLVEDVQAVEVPEDRILQHLYMPRNSEVHIDDAINIVETGQATHEEVMDAAKNLLVASSSNGFAIASIHLGQGEYFRENEWVLNARINLFGVKNKNRPRNSKSEGSILRSRAGGNLDTPTNYLIRYNDSNDGGFNGNFDQHMEDIRFIGHGGCRGVLFGGAQISTIRDCSWEGARPNANRPGFVDVTLFCDFGRPVNIYNCEIGNPQYLNGISPSGFSGIGTVGPNGGYAFNVIASGTINCFGINTDCATAADLPNRASVVAMGVETDTSLTVIGWQSEAPNIILMAGDVATNNPRGNIFVRGLAYQSPTTDSTIFVSNEGGFDVSGTVRNGNSCDWLHLPTNNLQPLINSTGVQEHAFHLFHEVPSLLTA